MTVNVTSCVGVNVSQVYNSYRSVSGGENDGVIRSSINLTANKK